ncbi:phosphatase PAP2 family protein [Methyloversatilis thermotolerans]|uniref:phosphatase PAP2 family protein n=1 Tax=Methyloversatilis thermotolerans TaxID=1346290 RepID=UPI0003776A87|nr:phosphatase PAP2 family protein [Methyloversatilis thermotolerans]
MSASITGGAAALAELLATRIWLVYAVLLIGALAAAALIFVAWRDWRGTRDARLTAIVIAGLCAIGTGAIVFACIAFAVHRGNALPALDDALVDALATHATVTTLQVFAVLTRFGDTEVLTVLGVLGTAVLLWRHQYRLAATWAAVIGGNSLLNVSLKSAFQRARPVHEHGVTMETSWSFPSGHASGTVAAWGVFAYVLLQLLPARWHLPVVLAAVAVALTTGFSRIVLQVHFASDVVAGMLSGACWLALCIVASECGRRRRIRT